MVYDAVPKHVGAPWTRRRETWLQSLAGDSGPLALRTRLTLASQLDQLTWLKGRLAAMDRDVVKLAGTPRYPEPVRVATEEKGLGVLTALVFLTEMGDLRRFANRADVGDFVGLAPSRDQSGACEAASHRHGRSIRR